MNAQIKDGLKFRSWMIQVDREVEQRTGMSVYDLPDCPFADWYEDEYSPRRAANKAIRSAKNGDWD